jgi:NDP-sugar pyrophosphorylase family protein/aminoglycoside/choline kinase family phosphotransferase
MSSLINLIKSIEKNICFTSLHKHDSELRNHPSVSPLTKGGIEGVKMNLSIFILAAGLGERLRPITDHIPKPLLPILGKPILQSTLEKVSTLPVQKIGINLHHKKELVENWIRQSAFNEKVELFPEDPARGTGGALKNAENFLNAGTFIAHNSDIVSDIDLGKLLEFHLSSDNLLTLAVHDYPEFNNLMLDEEGFLIAIRKTHPHPTPSPSMGRETKRNSNPHCGNVNKETALAPGGRGQERGGTATFKYLAFTGIAVYSPEFLRFLPIGFSSVVDAWLKAIEAGYKVGTSDVSGCLWSDIGTPASYASTVINELRKNGETVYIHPSIEICRQVELGGYVVAEKGVFLDEGNSFRNCILLPGSTIEKEKADTTPTIPPSPREGKRWVFENCILGSGFKIDLSESEMFGLPSISDALLIGTGGSDRRYYRIRKNQNTEILMQCFRSDPDFQRHIEYTQFFQEYAIPVPKLLHVEPRKMSATFEDLGDLSLYSFLKCPHDQKEIEEVYKRVIDILILMQTAVTEHISECPLLQNRIFDYEHLRWETSYFIDRFIEGIISIRVKNLSVLNDEFHRLAIKVDSFPKTVVHRDFQSQNIMITKGESPRVVDYQGARIGPPAYDIVSLLWDPYYRLEHDLREKLLDYYIDKIKKSYNNKVYDTTISPLNKGRYGEDIREFISKTTPPHPCPLPPGERDLIISPPLRGGDEGEGDIYGFSEINFKETLLPCRLQRHMQALGAYGFLSKIKGKKYFLKYVPEGLRLLKEDISLAKDEYPELYDLVMSL